MMNKIKIKTGKLLLAEPFMLNPYFRRAVILLCDHHKNGTLGLMLNKPLDIGIHDLIPSFPELESKVYYGGPVDQDTVHFLHSAGEILDGSVYVSDGVYWGGDFDKLKILIDNQLITSNDIRFFVGYSGWEPNQLADELKEGSWIMADMFPNYLYRVDHQVLWQHVMDDKGDHYSIISTMPDVNRVN